MAESATRKGRRAAANNTEDSVEAEFGGDFSEASLEAIRQLGRKGAQFGAVERWEEEAVQPPPQEECDAAVEELKSLERALDAVKQYVPDSKELAWIDYKRALVEDASDDEVTWLKLKAYYHGLDALRASSSTKDAEDDGSTTGVTAAAATAASTLSSDVDAARESVLRAARALLPSSSGDEEDGVTAALSRMATNTHASTSRTGGISAPAAPALVPTTAAAATGTTYHPDYLEEVRLTQQLAQQRSQRSSAFVLGLAAAVGVSVFRWWLRRGRAGNGGSGASRRPAALQPVSQ